MLFSRVGLYKASESNNLFIVEVGHDASEAPEPVHISNPLTIDEAKFMLRHMDLTDTEIDNRVRQATSAAPLTAAAGR